MSMKFEPDWVIIPGETIIETMEHHNMTKEELADKMRLPIEALEKILSGTAPITTSIAHNLERVFGVTHTFWRNLELDYQAGLERLGLERPSKLDE